METPPADEPAAAIAASARVGSGASTTHNPTNLPTLVAGGNNLGIHHGVHWRQPDSRMSNMYLSILRTLKIEVDSFADSTGTLSDSIFPV